MFMMRNYLPTTWIRPSTLLAAAILVGCAGQTVSPIVETTALERPENTNVESERANQQLAAVEALVEQHRVDEATLILDSLNFNQLTTENQTRYAFARIDTALILGDGIAALSWLRGQYAYLFDGLPLEKQIELSFKRAEAYELSGQSLAAARERIFLAPVLDDDEVIQFNQDQIWFNLQLVGVEQLRALAEQESSPDLMGWLELAIIGYDNSDDLYRLLASIEAWQKRNSAHPAATNLPASLVILKDMIDNQPQTVAVLLPLSGPLEKAGLAIRDGIVSAWYHAKTNEQTYPELLFFDTAGNEDIQSLYQQAMSEGAQLVIGPLAKTNVNRLSELETVAAPVLALNYVDRGRSTPDQFYQFGLAPEDEAQQVANDLWQEGARNIMVLAPNTEWGIRVSDAFIAHWQLKGGSIASKELFTQPDQYLSAIKRALNVDKSEQRHTQLERLTGSSMIFEPRRRQDIDAVFMLAFPAQARQLKPVLNFQRASSIPVVATSAIYTGSPDPSRDQDLEGVRFIDMPWRLNTSPIRENTEAAFNDSVTNYANLVALGVDAYRLYSRLGQMAAFPEVTIAGETGSLSMSQLHTIQRTLEWAVITNGLPERQVALEGELSFE